MSVDTTINKPKMRNAVIPAPKAWHGPDLVDDDFVVELGKDCMAELEAIIAEQRKAPVPTLVLQPAHFSMDACCALLRSVKQRLDDGLGFVILDRLPVDRWSPREVTDVYWLLGSLVEPPVAQEWSGTMIYNVRYDGQGYTADTRAALTPEGSTCTTTARWERRRPTTSPCCACRLRAAAARARLPAPMLRTITS
jgi:hypothetical protein